MIFSVLSVYISFMVLCLFLNSDLLMRRIEKCEKLYPLNDLLVFPNKIEIGFAHIYYISPQRFGWYTKNEHFLLTSEFITTINKIHTRKNYITSKNSEFFLFVYRIIEPLPVFDSIGWVIASATRTLEELSWIRFS